MQFAFVNHDGSLGGLFNDPAVTVLPAGATALTEALYDAWMASPGSLLLAGVLAPPSGALPLPPVTITSAAYLARFTASETTAFQTAALAQPPTANSLQLFGYLLLTAGSGTVTLTDPAVVARHAFLVAQGVLTSARSAAILTP